MLNSKENISFLKRLVILAIPIILQDLLNASVNMLDTVMIGRLGIEEVTAIGLANQIFFLFSLVCYGVAGGSSIFTGQFFGSGDMKSIHKVLGITFVSATFSATIFGTGAIFFPHILMRIYSNDEVVIELASQYLQIVGISYFLTAITASFNSSLRSIGQTKIPMTTTFIALFTNIILSYIFIFVLHMGVKGSATATLIARSIELIAQLIIIFKLKLPVAARIKDYFVADKAFIKQFFSTISPVIINAIVWSFGVSIYQIAYKFAGMEAQGSIQIASTVQNLFMVMGISIGSACSIMIANLLGAGKIEKAISYSRKCLVIALIFSSVMGLMLVLISPFIVNFFEISDSVKNNVRNILYVIAFGMPIKTFNYTAIVGILRSGGDTKFCLILDTIAVWLVGIPLAFLGAAFLQLPIHLVLLIMLGEEVLKSILSGRRVFKNKWARKIVD